MIGGETGTGCAGKVDWLVLMNFSNIFRSIWQAINLFGLSYDKVVI